MMSGGIRVGMRASSAWGKFSNDEQILGHKGELRAIRYYPELPQFTIEAS